MSIGVVEGIAHSSPILIERNADENNQTLNFPRFSELRFDDDRL